MYWIYFDFDGTIADSFGLSIEVANHLAIKYKFKLVDTDKISYYRDLSAKEVLKEFDISWLKLLIVAPIFRREFHKRIDNLKPIDGIVEVIQQISSQHHLGILTSNSEKNVFHFLEKYQIKEFFSDIVCMNSLFGKDKILRKIIRKKHIDSNKMIYIGDEIRDIEAAQKVGIKSIAVCWGFNSQNVLYRQRPNACITTIADLKTQINSLTTDLL